MTSAAGVRKNKAPFPWFGGKSGAASHIWAALGDVHHYVEPFAGSLAVLLLRPHEANRTYHSETVNDVDGLLVNAWRSIQLSPDATADAASWPVAEADLHARHLTLVRWREERQLEHLMGDPAFHDPVMAGWWLWGQSAWIGSGWCSGRGAWTVGADGRITKGQGADRKRPNVGNNGKGVAHAGAREPGVARQLPRVSCSGTGVNQPLAREAGVGDFHELTMPEVLAWFRFLSARLRHVRILNGDWSRAVTSGAVKLITVRTGKGKAGIFLDPPYAGSVRAGDLYAYDDYDVAADVNRWCVENGDDHDLRIVVAGFDEEHRNLVALGWREVEWFRAGFLSGGMGNTSKKGTHQQHRERLWMSPHCLDASVGEEQSGLFGEGWE